MRFLPQLKYPIISALLGAGGLPAHDPAFFAVPGLDSREPSTSFSVRGRDLRVDFLTPAGERRGSTKPVYLLDLRVAARPLYGLDYLIDQSVDAAVIAANGIRVNVPAPARFAFHKLWLAAERPASEAAKSKKDLRRAWADSCNAGPCCMA